MLGSSYRSGALLCPSRWPRFESLSTTACLRLCSSHVSSAPNHHHPCLLPDVVVPTHGLTLSRTDHLSAPQRDPKHTKPNRQLQYMFLFVFVEELTAGTGGMEAGRKADCRVNDNLWSTMFVCWKLWPMANTFNFVPAKLRVLCLIFAGLEWNIYMSSDDVDVLGFVVYCVVFSFFRLLG